MPDSVQHQEVEARFREIAATAGLPEPDEVGHLRRAVVFLWYESKLFVLVDLEELPVGEDPLDGLDLAQLAFDLEAGDDDFAQTG
jgi:hypothetical protein